MTFPPAQPSQPAQPVQPANDASPAAPSSVPQTTPNNRPQRRNDGPRRIKNGLRFRRKDGADNLPWPSSAWAKLVLGQLAPEHFNEALEYARAGQTASISISPGLVEAIVQGRAARPYRVRIDISPITAADWDRVVATMAAEAIWSAKLLSGELPQTIELLFRGLGNNLVHEREDQLAHTCTCSMHPELAGKPCKHVGVTWLLVAERVEADPLLSFTLRGLDGQRLLERLQEARTIATRGVSRAHSTPPAAESTTAPPPVERCLQDFWKPGRRLAEVDEIIGDEHVPHAILRRLGPSPFQASANRAARIQAAPAKGQTAPTPPPSNQPTSKFPLVGLLASIYDSIATAGRTLSDQPPETTTSDPASK